jgi:hypothetical protein
MKRRQLGTPDSKYILDQALASAVCEFSAGQHQLLQAYAERVRQWYSLLKAEAWRLTTTGSLD